MTIDFKKKTQVEKKTKEKERKENCLSNCELDIHRNVFVPTLVNKARYFV